MNFNELNLGEELHKALNDKGYVEPTEIQKQAIPVVLSGRDVMASSQTGTGKTASFVLPILKMLNKSEEHSKSPQVLILVPTRELANQVSASVAAYGRYLGVRSTAVYGGVQIKPQIDRLKRGIDIVTATPGRLIDLIHQKKIQLNSIKQLVLDEADRMLDMGFIDDIKSIVDKCPSKRQTLLFSATYSLEIKYLIKTFLKDPAIVSVTPQNTTVEKARQSIYKIPRSHRTSLLIHLIRSEKWQRALIFTPTKIIADRLYEKLEECDVNTAVIHSDKTQAVRQQTLDDFKKGNINILIATDIAARGLDIVDLAYVVNYELPKIAEDYVHRIGRTARAGKSGEAISFISEEEKMQLKKLERFISQSIPINKTPPYPILKDKRDKDTPFKNKINPNKRKPKQPLKQSNQFKNKKKTSQKPTISKSKKEFPKKYKKENPFKKN
jgi:ATP-dependent RNA helicase RhlE